MRDLTKSFSSLSWAMTLFGLQQLTNMMRSDGTAATSSRAADAFDAVTRSTQSLFGDTLGQAFEAGDKMQRSMVDLMFAMMGNTGMGGMGQGTPGMMGAMPNMMGMMPGAMGMMGAGSQGGCGSCGSAQTGGSPGQASTEWGPMSAADQ